MPSVLSGIGLTAVDDQDEDQREDYAISIPTLANRAGVVQVVSSATGRVLLKVAGNAINDYIGEHLAGVLDMNQDGVNELAYSSRVSWLTVVSGHGTQAIDLEGMWKPSQSGLVTGISGVRDLDGDNVDELLVGVSEPRAPRHARVCAGRDGHTLLILADPRRSEPPDEHWYLSETRVSSIGDVNDDGMDDLLIGFPPQGYFPGEAADSIGGIAVVFSGRDGAQLEVQQGHTGEERYGEYVGGGQRWNDDSVPDYCVGGMGFVSMFAGDTGDEIMRIVMPSDRCAVLDTSGDLDGDERADVLATSEISSGRPFGLGSSIAIWSGRSGELIGRIESNGCMADHVRACFINDLDADKCDEIVIALPGTDRSRVVVVSGSSIVQGKVVRFNDS